MPPRGLHSYLYRQQLKYHVDYSLEGISRGTLAKITDPNYTYT